jgi:hypothetical protein
MKADPYLWLQGIAKTTESKKKPAVNRYRLVNVVFSEQLRSALLQFGRPLTKDDLESRVKTNQKLYKFVPQSTTRGPSISTQSCILRSMS